MSVIVLIKRYPRRWQHKKDLADNGYNWDTEKSSSEIKLELSNVIDTDWVPSNNHDSDIIHIPMEESEFLDYEYQDQEEVVIYLAKIG